jgi:hypothetical protein
MKKAILLCFFIAAVFFTKAQPTPAPSATPTVSPEELCGAAMGFLNELITGSQYEKVLGSIYSKSSFYGSEWREYNSTENFPLAKRTTIVDTNSLSSYRSAKALMLSQTLPTAKIGKDMLHFFDALSSLLEKCLVPQKYEYDLSPQLVEIHVLKLSFHKEMPSTDKGLFSSLQFGNHIELEVYIDQAKNKDGTFTNELYLRFERT